MENLIFSLNATVPVFLVMVIGYMLKTLKMMDEPFVKTLNKFNYNITLPLLLFQDIAGSDFSAVWDTSYVLFCFFCTLFCIASTWIITAKAYHKKDLVGEFVQASYRSSAAVLGIAFIQNIYGNAGMAPLMIIGTVPLYNVAAVIILSFTAPAGSSISAGTDHPDTGIPATGLPSSKERIATDRKAAIQKSVKGIFTNPIILGIVLGMVVSVCGISFPAIVNKTVNYFAVLATPLALIGLGGGFEGKKALAKLKPTLVCSFIKLILWPLLFLPVAVFMGFTAEKLVAILVMLASPTTVSCYIMAKNMKHEGILTSSVVVTTTLLSSVTLTFWLYLLKSMGLI